ncbi:MAG: zf-HC2 domain-containing protein [Actinomycetia bacterium]|nr:zf-HC2 domain-containing protein [Actinomycetes bacterium]
MTLSCNDLDTLLPESLDGELSGDQEAQAAEHLATCAQCTLELGELQGVTRLYSENGALKLPDDARRRIAAALGIDL